MYAFAKLGMVKEFVKGFHGQAIKHKRGQVERQGQWQALFHRFGGQCFGLVVIATHEDTPAQVLSADQQIHPGHSIFVILVRPG